MNYLEMNRLSLNEGLFKDIDKEMVSIDDPEYEQKVKDQTFKDLQTSDALIRKHNEILNWIVQNLFYYDYTSRSVRSGYVTESDEGVLFSISGNTPDTIVIDLLGKELKYLVKPHYSDNNTHPFTQTADDTAGFGLPYKFRNCAGTFMVDANLSEDLKNLNLFTNIPTEIGKDLIIRNNRDCDIWINPQTLPANLHIGHSLQISGDSIHLDRMPDNLKVDGQLIIGYNNTVEDMRWWNPTMNVNSLTIKSCNEFYSLKGLPDNTKFEYLRLSETGIRKIEGWPRGLTVAGILTMENNNLSTESLTANPFPADLSVETLMIGKQYPENRTWSTKPQFIKKLKRTVIPIPRGVERFYIWRSVNDPIDEVESNENAGYWKWMDNSHINEGLFKDIDKETVSIDDPDYEQKVKDQTFKDLQTVDKKTKKEAIIDWISDNVFVLGDGFYERLTREYMAKHEVDWSYTGEPPYYYIDDNNFIHFPNPTVTYIIGDRSPLKSVQIDELPYKIKECAGSLVAKGIGLKSLRNFPYKVGHNLDISRNYSLKSLRGCPQEVGWAFCASQCDFTSLEGGPQKVGGDHLLASGIDGNYWAENGSLTSLKGLPSALFGNVYITYNHLTSLGNLSDVQSSQDNIIYVANNYLGKDEVRRVIDNYGGKLNFNGLDNQLQDPNRLSLNEGLFKDLDKNIVSVDDPEYEQKVKDQTFKDFQDADINQQKVIIKEWLEDHLLITICRYNEENQYSASGPYFLSYYRDVLNWPNDKLEELCSIDDNLEISLSNKEANYQIEIDPVSDKISDHLPYKFKYCAGGFRVRSRSKSKYGPAYDNSSIRSLKNYPVTIDGWLSLDDMTNLNTLEGFPKTVKGFVEIQNCGITSLAGCAPEIGGNFMIKNCPNLNTLEGGPSIVHGDYILENLDSLTSLKGCPVEVGKDFICNDNLRIETTKYISPNISGNICIYNNVLDKLEDLPEKFSGNINFSKNCLTSLEGAPSIILGKFDVSENKLMTLKGCPKFIDGDFNVSCNYLTEIDYFPENIDKAQNFGFCAVFNVLTREAYLDFVDKFLTPKNINPASVKIYTKFNGLRQLISLGTSEDFGIQSWSKMEVVNLWKSEQKKKPSLNEGLFKDLDKNIVSIDDPDYEQKVKDQTFDDFQEVDRKKIQEAIKEAEEWVYDHVSIGHVNGYGRKALTPKDKPEWFYVDNNLGIHFCHKGYGIGFGGINYVIHKNTKKEEGPITIPYKIVECTGGFHIADNTVNSCKNFPAVVATDLLCQYQPLGSLSDLPKDMTVGGECSFYGCNLTSLDDMPETLAVGRDLGLEANDLSIKDMVTLQDRLVMSDNFQYIWVGFNSDIKEENVKNCKDLTDLFKSKIHYW